MPAAEAREAHQKPLAEWLRALKITLHTVKANKPSDAEPLRRARLVLMSVLDRTPRPSHPSVADRDRLRDHQPPHAQASPTRVPTFSVGVPPTTRPSPEPVSIGNHQDL
jgi:hypothetical protein